MRWATAILVCTILAAGQAGAVLSLLGIKNSMVEFLLDQLSTEGVFEITAEEVVEPGDGVTSIRGLQITDRDGVWLTAARLDFEWDPTRLLSGEVEFNTLTLEDLHVRRQPILPESEPEETTATEEAAEDAESPLIAWPRSPLTLRVDQMTMNRVRIDAPVLGHAIAFDATGSARDEGDIQAAQLNLTRTDQIAGTIAFDYRRNFRRNTLMVNLEAREAPGGMVASLADLPPDAPSEIVLNADGPPNDWRVALELTLAGLVEADGTAIVAYEGPIAVDADFKARPGPKLPPNVSAVLGTEARLRAKLSEDADGLILIEDGRITSPDANMTVAGSLSRTTGAADLNVMLEVGSGFDKAIPGFELQGLRFDGDVSGAPDSFQAKGQAQIRSLRSALADVDAADLTIDLGQAGATGAVTTKVDVAGQAQGLRLDRIQANQIGTAQLAIVAALTGSELDLANARLDSELLKITAKGTADIESAAAELALQLSTPDLADVAGAYGVDVGGAIGFEGTARHLDGKTDLTFSADLDDFAHELADAGNLTVAGTVKTDGARTGFDLTGGGSALRIDRLGPDLLPKAEFVAIGVLDGDDADLERFVLTSPLLQAKVSGQANLTNVSGTFDYDLASPKLGTVAAAYDAPIAGAVKATGRASLSGPDGVPRLDGQASFSPLEVDGQSYGNVEIDHDVNVSDEPSGRVDLSVSRTPVGAARVGTNFALAGQQIALTDLSAALPGTTAASNNLTVAFDTQTAAGRVRINAPKMGALLRAVGMQGRGAVSGTVDLTSASGRQNAKIALSGKQIAIADASIAALTAAGRISDVTGQPSANLSLDIAGVSASGIEVTDGTVSVSGPMTGADVRAKLNGQYQRDPLSVDAAARVRAAGGSTSARVTVLDAAIGGATIGLNKPLSLTINGSVIRAKDLDLSLPGGGFVAGDLTSFGSALAGNLRLNMPNLAEVNRIAETPVQTGAMTARATFDTRRSRAIADATVTVRDLTFDGVDGTGALGLQADLGWQGRRANLSATLSGDFGAPMTINAELPVRAGGMLPQLARRGPVSASVNWSGAIGSLWALVPAPAHVLTGTAKVDLAVSGDIADPKISGGVSVDGGGYQNLDAGTILTDLTMKTSLSPDGALGLDVSASDGAGGTLKTTGTISLDGDGLDIATKITDAVLVRREDVTARIDGSIEVKGGATGLDVTGALTIPEADVRLVNANPPEIVTLGEVIIKGAPEIDNAPETSSTRLRIDIDAPGRLFVRGRGLDSEWKLGLKIRGDAANPVMTGAIEKVRGKLVLIGKNFDLTRGKITFPPADEIDPLIDVVLERETSDLTGRIIVSGPASDPELRFASVPALPEDEVLPRALFGKSSQALTSSQAIQLGVGLATLMDGGAGTLEQLRGATGLDSIQVEQDDEGNASIAVGKEVSEGVWVGTRQPIGEGGTAVAVEIEIFDDITIDTEVEAGGGSSVGIQWKRDF